MSGIGSVRDGLQELRKRSLSQERAIDRSKGLSHWRLSSDATKTTFVERGLGIAGLPILMFWGLLLGVLSLGIGICLVSFKFLSRFFR